MTNTTKPSAGLARSIVLYNPLSGRGHFDSWCSIFTSSLVNLGWTVHVITPEKKPILRTLLSLNVDPTQYRLYDRETCFSRNMHLKLIPLTDEAREPTDIASKDRPRTQLTYKQSSPGRWINLFKKGLRFLTKPATKIKITLRRFLHPKLIISHLDPLIFSRDIAILKASLSSPPDLILNMYIDQFDTDIGRWSKFSQISNFNWLCIHFDTYRNFLNHEFAISDRLKGVLHINEDMRSPEKSLYKWIPDVTLTLSSGIYSNEIQSIKRRAKGRKIVFLGGAISGDKNLSIWYETIFRSDPKKWFFLQVGRIDRSTLTEQDLFYLAKIEQENPENLIILNQYVEDELVFNSYLEVCDIVWCLYRSFKRSSNLLNKAATFRKPVLVSLGHLMGERAQQFKIGIVASENDSQSVINALNNICSESFVEKNFSAYTKQFGLDAFERALNIHLTDLSPFEINRNIRI